MGLFDRLHQKHSWKRYCRLLDAIFRDTPVHFLCKPMSCGHWQMLAKNLVEIQKCAKLSRKRVVVNNCTCNWWEQSPWCQGLQKRPANIRGLQFQLVVHAVTSSPKKIFVWGIECKPQNHLQDYGGVGFENVQDELTDQIKKFVCEFVRNRRKISGISSLPRFYLKKYMHIHYLWMFTGNRIMKLPFRFQRGRLLHCTLEPISIAKGGYVRFLCLTFIRAPKQLTHSMLIYSKLFDDGIWKAMLLEEPEARSGQSPWLFFEFPPLRKWI